MNILKTAFNKTNELTKKALLATGMTALFNKVSGISALNERGLKRNTDQKLSVMLGSAWPIVFTSPIAIIALASPLGWLAAPVALAATVATTLTVATSAIRLQSWNMIRKHKAKQKKAQQASTPRI